MKMKRLLSFALSLVLVLGSASALPSGVFDESTSITASADVEGDWEYSELDDGTVEITRYNRFDSEVVIPSILDGKTVTSIGKNAFGSHDEIERITIPSSVTSIAEGAFQSCYGITSLTIPDGVTSIGKNAFDGCIGLTSVIIPGSVTSISDSAFYGCESLKSITIQNGVTSIDDKAFEDCTNLTDVTIPSSVERIGNEAFYGCSKLKSISIPESVTKIGNFAFMGCESLTSITIPKGVKIIGYRMFEGCKKLTSVTIPNSVKSIEEGAFYNCSSLKSITIPSSVTSITNESIGFTEDGQMDGFTIYCYEDTVGEIYAMDYGFNYFLLEKFEPEATRLAGAGRYETAVEISKAGFPNGSDTVVLAYGLNYADALAGVSLAKAKNAPILLTNLKTLPAETLAEIKRLKAKNVIILGGTGAVGKEVEAALNKEGLKTERIAGATRFETATKIAQKMQVLNDNKAPEDIFFVYAFNSADALSVSAVAAVKGAPVIYLKTTGDLDDATAAYLKSIKGSVKNAYVIGGEGVISKDMMKKTRNALGVTPLRVFGANRFETCVAVNEKFADVLDGDMLCVATGMDFPDALAGGVYAAINKAPLFLINGKAKTPQLSDEQKAYLKTKAAEKITAFGGVGVVPDNHIADIAKNSI